MSSYALLAPLARPTEVPGPAPPHSPPAPAASLFADVPASPRSGVTPGWAALRLASALDGLCIRLGILLGTPSGGLLDVDLDAREAVALAETFLPNTACRFGRAGKQNSHWIHQPTPLLALTETGT